MEFHNKHQLSNILNHNDPNEVFKETKKIFTYHYSDKVFLRIEHMYKMINSLYNGTFTGYRYCNTVYHDFNHINHVLLATARIIDGLNVYEGSFSETKAVNLLLAALLHDTGYIQKSDDLEGTGAKYTAVHVERSIEFIRNNYKMLKLSPEDIPAISAMIECTSMTADPIDKFSGDELLCGAIMATADIIGQMSDRLYLEKLLFLYYEFLEAGIGGYKTAFNILERTYELYQSTKDRLDGKLCAFYELTKYHFQIRYNIDENLYIIAIENQINYLQNIILESDDVNYKNKLRRLNFNKKD